MSKWKKVVSVVLAALAALAIVIFYPFQITTVPEWTVKVLRDDGEPGRGIVVRQHWRHYAVESENHEEIAMTDNDGYVSFPRRTVRASFFNQYIGKMRNIRQQGIHASFNPSSQLVAFGNGFLGSVRYEPDSPLPKELRLWRMEP